MLPLGALTEYNQSTFDVAIGFFFGFRSKKAVILILLVSLLYTSFGFSSNVCSSSSPNWRFSPTQKEESLGVSGK